MTDFAVIRVAGKQHVVSPGSEIEITGDPKNIEVLLLSQGDNISVGTPLVEKAGVASEVISTGKGPKIRVAKFKSKVRYRKVMGFRPIITRLKINDLLTDSGEHPRISKRGTKKPASI